MQERTDQDDAQLAAKVAAAIKEVDAATAARNEKALVAGRLLVEAQKRHPTEKAFAKFLQLAGGIQIRRARDLIALAQGRRNFEKQQADNAAAQQRHRDKLKAEKIEREKRAALPKPDPKPEPKPKGKPEQDREAALRNAAASGATSMTAEELRVLTGLQQEQRLASAATLQEFKEACRRYLPQLSADDLSKAYAYMNDGVWKAKINKREAA